MELYIIRHGLAGERGTYTNDEQRPLTEEGHHRTRHVANRLHQLGIQFDLIQTSPLVRARQTAEILQSAGLSQQLQESAALKPGGEINTWLEWLQSWSNQADRTLAIVGHEPDLGEWAEQLIWGESHHSLVVKKAGVIGLLLPDRGSPIGQSQLFWLTPPRLLIEE